MLLPASLLSMWVKPRIQTQPAGVLGVGKRRERGEQHIIQVSGEDHNDGVAHAATDWFQSQTRRKNEGEEGKKSGAGCAPKDQGEKKKRGKSGRKRRGGARWKYRVHLTSARMCSSHATLPCCCVRSGEEGGCVDPCPCQCVAMSCVASHAIITMMSCLCASVFSNQPSLSVSVCVCVKRARQCRQQQESTHTPKKRECVCEEEERETASQMNQPSEATCVCVCVCEEQMRKKKEKREKRVAEEEKREQHHP